MVRHISFDNLYFADHGWLQSRFHFSFADYRNKNNMNFGVLRVMNDDRIGPHSGFHTHPHTDMEIVSYVLQGELTHQDSMGHRESLGRGAIQYMSAGTGITHSEMNDGDDEVHLIQTWILPQDSGLTPQYGSKAFALAERRNKWLHLVGPEDTDVSIHLYQDANMYVSEIDKDQSLIFEIEPGRQLYLKVMEGWVNINGITFHSGDAAEAGEETLRIRALSHAHLLLVEMRQDWPEQG